ncbi:hypothetical protein SKAU_G00377900 [Synaphobranchus kaupii]|uniref:ZP domain-containing protein n=1 Tax=Synaphobranchus kaupii TaxID=118154 RepID=A0A9Q1IDI9_SYNKA|nr:hypothetical protein SKAU_G00377900 [Synaphobranchus kaupii]
MTLVQVYALLFVVAGHAVHAEVSVECGWNDTVVVKWTELQLGTGNLPDDIRLGNCLPSAFFDGKGGEIVTQFSSQLDDCSFRRLVTEDQIIYSNELSYVAMAGGIPTLYPIECVYEKPKGWVRRLYKPNWQLHASGTLLFNMALMNGDFSGPAQSSTFYLGSLIPIWAAVDQQDHLPLLLLLDECVAATTPELDPSGTVYPIITNGGCLMDSKFGFSSFRPRVRTSELELHLQAFRFALGEDVYIHCKLSAWDPQRLDEGKKACNFNQGRWELLDDPSQSSLCSCCDAHCKYRRRRGVTSGLHGMTHNAVLGPLVIREAQGMGFNASVKSLMAGF